jgi:hypothetical protein
MEFRARPYAVRASGSRRDEALGHPTGAFVYFFTARGRRHGVGAIFRMIGLLGPGIRGNCGILTQVQHPGSEGPRDAKYEAVLRCG